MAYMHNQKWREKVAVKAREVLKVVRRNPGITAAEINEKTGFPATLDALNMLQRHSLVSCKQPLQENGRRPQKWYAAEEAPILSNVHRSESTPKKG
jgi:predicted DNA-binding ArsR family transcriptional regulator